jgi:hypothetical protein
MSSASLLPRGYFDKLYYLYQLDATRTFNASIQLKLEGESPPGTAEHQTTQSADDQDIPINNTFTQSFIIDAHGPEGYEAFVDIKIYSSAQNPLIVSLGKKLYDTKNMCGLSITDRKSSPVSTAHTPVRIYP